MELDQISSVLQLVLPIDYWENEFRCSWKNGKCPDPHFLKFLDDYRANIGPRVLDIGSGDGRHILVMAKEGHKVTGLELTASGIKTTQKRLDDCELSAHLVRGSFHGLPFKDGWFDSLVSTQALHYNNWKGVQKSFAEASRVLKKGGLFFFRARSDKGHWRETDQQIEDYGTTRIEARGKKGFVVMVHDFTLAELLELAEGNKFYIINEPLDHDKHGKPGQWNVVFQKM